MARDRHAAHAGAALLLLDEPVAGMTDEETMRSAALLDRLRGTLDGRRRARHGVRRALAGAQSRVTVMAEGRVLAQGTLDEVKRDEAVVESYLGR